MTIIVPENHATDRMLTPDVLFGSPRPVSGISWPLLSRGRANRDSTGVQNRLSTTELTG